MRNLSQTDIKPLVTNVPRMEDRLLYHTLHHHRETGYRVFKRNPLGVERQTVILYRDRSIADAAAEFWMKDNNVCYTPISFDMRKDDVYTKSPHHVFQDQAYKQVFEMDENTLGVVMVGTRAKPADSWLEKLAYTLNARGTISEKGSNILNVSDPHGVKIVTKDEESVEKVITSIKKGTHYRVIDEDDYYACPKIHNHSDNPHPIISQYRAHHLILESTIDDDMKGVRIEFQVVDQKQHMYNAWEHRKHYLKKAKIRSQHDVLNGGFNLIVIEGTKQLWAPSKELAEIQVLPQAKDKVRNINQGKVFEVTPDGGFVDRYVHMPADNYRS